MKKLIFIPSLLLLLSCGIGGTRKKNIETSAPPLKIIVIQDFSLSQYQEKRLDMQHLEWLADSVARRGGLLAYGTIESNSNKPLEQLMIDEVPLSPFANEKGTNIFKKMPKEVKKQKMEEYKIALKTKQTSDDNEVARFLYAVQARMRKAKKASHSDVHNALERAGQLVCSPNTFRQTPQTYIIAVSDLVDDWIGGNRTRFTGFDCSGVAPIIAIGAVGAGNLELKQGTYVNVASIEEAIKYIFLTHHSKQNNG